MTNPYQAPQAPLSDQSPEPEGQGAPMVEPRILPPGQGAAWFAQAWNLFAVSPGLWMAYALILVGMGIGSGLVPYFGPFVQFLVYPFFFAGVAAGADALRRGRALSLAHLFAGLAHQTRQLLLLGAIYAAVSIAISLVVLSFFRADALQALFHAETMPAEIDPELLLMFLVAMSLNIPLLMAMWFAPILVYLHGMPATLAMRVSFIGCLRNLLPFLIYGIVALLLAFAATLPMLLGWFVLMPVLVLSAYVAYRDIYFEAGAGKVW